MSGDKYKTFDELRCSEREGVDFRIRLSRRTTGVAILAPHGGKIEPGTSQIAEAIAGDEYSLYCFEGLRKRGNRDLHITSTKFSEPQCVDLISACDLVVAVHGVDEKRLHVEIGGLGSILRDGIYRRLKEAGFSAQVVTRGDRAGRNAGNICNRGSSGHGVQLEITRGLRDVLIASPADLRRFAEAVRTAIEYLRDQN
jgi:phage replication-related protein YjqB (UPF0714/DUF867 family)